MTQSFEEELREDLKKLNECAPLWPALTTVLEAATRYLKIADELKTYEPYREAFHIGGAMSYNALLARVRELME